MTTVQKNNENKNIYKSKKTSIYHGVFFIKTTKKYDTRCTLNGKRVFLGSFADEIEAATTYDIYVVQKGALHMQLNFPDKNYENEIVIVPKKQTNATGFIGVRVTGNCISASISFNKKIMIIGYFKTTKEAAEAYDKFIVDNNIPNRKLNFPLENLEYNPLSIIKTPYKDIDNKTIEINDGIIIDKEDYDKIKYYKIFLSKGYALINICKSKILHRFLMNVTDPLIYIDHIDGNKLNNSKSNLRISNAKLNAQNRTSKKSSGKYLGVREVRPTYFRSSIKNNGKTILMVNDSDEEKVARFRDLFILNYVKEDHYPTNFKWNETIKAKWDLKFNEAVLNKKGITINI